MKTILVAAGLLMLACSSASAAETGWFTPQLIAGKSAECAPMLANVRAQFAATGRWDHEQPLDIPGLHASPIEYSSDETVRPAFLGTRQIKIERQPGCGGACEGQIFTVLAGGKPTIVTPEATFWLTYTDGKTREYLAGITGDTIEVYDVARDGADALLCRIALEPDLSKMTDTDVLNALRAVDTLKQAASGMARGGFCGSLRTDSRWADSREQALHAALYRPWAVLAWNDPTSANSYGDYDRILPQLKQWSLGGLGERAAFQQYTDRLAATEAILTEFYVKRFGWPANKAREMAHSALTNAVASGFGFYMYKPFENEAEERLRAALFARAPMADIKAMPLDVKALDAGLAKEWPNEAKDSLLNVAIAYPQALRYLLDKGFDPNRANAFGKTPLMYAAQNNQLEAARMLLKAGADPNARTMRPPDDCGYRLSTTGMTPLHYAVRNAATPLIQTLLKSGAVTFIKAHREDRQGRRDETPLDWMHWYTGGEAGKEQNPNLTTQDVALLEKTLALPDPAALARLASAQTLLGEKRSAAGDAEAAYQAITVALQADPGNQKALADLPLLAFKTDRAGEAAAAATRATIALNSDAGKASAWFNLGLVCQKQAQSLSFDGKRYCDYDRIDPFLRAWQLVPTSGRAKKLAQVMEKDGISDRGAFCQLQGRAYRLMYGKKDQSRTVARLYVLHPAGETIDPKSISWTMRYAGKPATFLSPTQAGRHVLGDQALTVLESDTWSQQTMINGQACQTK